MAYKYPYGNRDTINLDWFINEFQKLKAAWEEERAGIEGALDEEIARAEAALADVFAARDTATTAANSASQSANTAREYSETATAQANAATQAAQGATSARSDALAAQSAAEEAASNASGFSSNASNSANAANNSAQSAAQSLSDALAAQSAAEEAASNASNSANAANNSAQSAAQSASDAEDAASSIEESAQQITTNTNDINSLKESTIDNFTLSANDFESGTYENKQKVNWSERLRTKQFYRVRRNDTVVWKSTTLQILMAVYPDDDTVSFGATGWVKSSELNTYIVPIDGLLFITVKKEAGGNISINDYDGIDIAINSSLLNRIDRLNADNGYIIRYWNSIDFEQGTINANGSNNENAYNKTRKNRSVTTVFFNKGDIITVLDKTLRASAISTSTIDNALVNSGWITESFTIPSTGFYRIQYGLKNDNNLNTSLYDFYEQGIVTKSKIVNTEEAIYRYITGITDAINSTHSYSGEALDLSKNVFSIKVLTSFSSLPSGVTSREGSAYYNGTLFKLYASNYVELYNYETMEKIAEYAIESNHGNGAEFSDEFYSASDQYPLLYVSDGATVNTITVHRVTDSEATLVRTLTFPETAGYFLSFGLDSRSQKIYTIGYLINDYQTAENNGCILCAWDLTKLTDNTSSYTPELISKTALPFIDTKQDAKYFNGKIYQISSNPYASSSKPTKLYVIGLDGVVSNIITDFNEPIRDHEMEGICFVPESNGYEYKIYIDGVSGTRFELLF